MKLIITETHQTLSFKTRPDGANPAWWLDLDLNGQPIYRIGNVCGTCEAMFQSVSDANLPLTPSELSAQLGLGLKIITPEITNTVSKILPEGTYHVGLINIQPELKRTATDPLYSRGHPEYYWISSEKLGLGCDYESELILPIVSENRLSPERIEWYQSMLNWGESPTALALSYLDIRVVSGHASVLNVVHFLLDGHHKMLAASKENKPLTLLSFFTTDNSFADKQTIKMLIAMRYPDSM